VCFLDPSFIFKVTFPDETGVLELDVHCELHLNIAAGGNSCDILEILAQESVATSRV